MSLLRAKAEIPKDYFLNKRRFIAFHWKGICYRWNCVCVSWKDEGPGCGLEDYSTAPSSSLTSQSFPVVIAVAFDLPSSRWRGKQQVRALMAWWHIYLLALTLELPSAPVSYSSERLTVFIDKCHDVDLCSSSPWERSGGWGSQLLAGFQVAGNVWD